MIVKKNDISVIIPMYNSEKTIIAVLEAINNQTGKEYLKEIIIVNDGSTDGSISLINEFISKIPVILINQSNSGVSSARNRGMCEATGNWIAFCDSDDIWLKEKIYEQVNVINSLQAKTEIDFLGSNHTNRDLRILCKRITKLHRATVKELCMKMYPQTSTVIMKKNIFNTIGGFDKTQKYAEDGNYFLKIVSKYKCYYLPKQLVVYDGGKRGFGSSGLSANLKGMHEGNLKNIRELRNSHDISFTFYLMMYLFYWAKYLRRIILVRVLKLLGR